MSYTALYRKFRPGTFEDVKGQDHIVKTLKNQLMADRIGHAYLFCGTRGTGKTSIAKIFARAVNCENPHNGSPCNECDACRAILSGSSMNVIEIDAASNNGVDNIREIREEVSYPPVDGKYKVYIIDEVHMLSIGAFNALLKTLEEPPSYVIFILATTEAHKIPVTILSRCQRYDFKRISQDTILARLQELADREGVAAEEKALRYIAKKGDGSMRDALSLMDQCIAFYLGETLTYDKVLEVLGAVDTEVFSRLLRRILKEDITGAILSLDELIMQGRDLTQFVNDFTWYMRNLMLVKNSEDMEDVLDVSSENLLQLKEEAAMIREDTLMRFIRIFSELSAKIRLSSNKRVQLEMAVIKLCKPEAERDEISLLERIRRLERGMSQILSGEASVKVQAAPAGVQESREGLETAFPEETEYKKAAPEDLKRIKSMWKSIVAETSGRFKVVLSAAEPKFNAQDPQDNRLFVVFADFLAEPYLNNTQTKELLEQIIRDKAGCQVEVKLVLAADEGIQKGSLASIDLEERMREFIHTDIEIEEEN